MRRCSAIVLVLALAVTLTGPAAAQPAPTISISVERDDIQFDYTRSHRELKSLAQCERPATAGKYLGLSRASVRTTFSYRVALRPTASGYAGGVISVDVTLHVNDRTVYVASELPEGSCSFRETMDHEMRHVSIDDTLVAMFRERVMKTLEGEMPGLTGLRGPTQQAITDSIYSRLETVLDQEMRTLRAMRLERHRAFDSSEEYIRLGAACGGETEALIRAEEENTPGWHIPVDCDDR